MIEELGCDGYPYTKRCECGIYHTLWSQEDGQAQNYVNVYLLCECNKYIKFIISADN